MSTTTPEVQSYLSELVGFFFNAIWQTSELFWRVMFMRKEVNVWAKLGQWGEQWILESPPPNSPPPDQCINIARTEPILLVTRREKGRQFLINHVSWGYYRKKRETPISNRENRCSYTASKTITLHSAQVWDIHSLFLSFAAAKQIRV